MKLGDSKDPMLIKSEFDKIKRAKHQIDTLHERSMKLVRLDGMIYHSKNKPKSMRYNFDINFNKLVKMQRLEELDGFKAGNVSPLA